MELSAILNSRVGELLKIDLRKETASRKNNNYKRIHLRYDDTWDAKSSSRATPSARGKVHVVLREIKIHATVQRRPETFFVLLVMRMPNQSIYMP